MRSPHARVPFGALALFLVVALAAGNALAVDVTACGQLIPGGAVRVLQADLVCEPDVGGIALGRGSTLQLNGHVLTAGSPVQGPVGIGCARGHCRVEGPGTVSGFGGAGILASTPSRLDVRGITVQGNGIGISTVTGNAMADVGSQHRPRLKGTTCGTSPQLTDTGASLGTWGLCTAD